MPTVEESLNDDFFESKSKIESILFIIGCLCFICSGTFVILHLGFVDTMIHHEPNNLNFLTKEQLWLVNYLLGIVGGYSLCPRTPISASLSGLISSLAITGLSLLYLSWRDSIMIVEFIIPLGLGIIPGVMLYRRIERWKENHNNKSI